MADFHQTGAITTLHRLRPADPLDPLGLAGPSSDSVRPADLERLESEIRHHAQSRPIALVLPCLYDELRDDALAGIIEILSHVDYLHQVVVSVDGAESRDQFDHMRSAFESIRTLDGRGAVLVWNDGPRLRAIESRLRAEGLDPGGRGKGRATWFAYGYVLAADEAHVVAVHDCDIRSYSRELLARLCFPTVHPNLNYEFAKGYYGRVTDRLHGRVTRLFMTPLLRAMKSVLGPVPLLDYLDSFRYPLAGECSLTTDLIRINRIPSDWGLEVGVLAEVFRNCSLKRVCQVELVENYEHKHRELSEADASTGLHRMVVDIAASLIRNLASYGVQFDAGFLNTLIAAYVRTAQDAIARYSDDAALNGLVFDRHEEEVAVETFSRALRTAGLSFVRDPMGAPQIPNWSRVTSALPDLLDELRAAVEADRRGRTFAVVSGGAPH